ncbi:MAG: V-type ATP synthase subunit D, partial [Treponema sp.]|nr:V-type ATP synthase subunit D [Treponema sp.]
MAKIKLTKNELKKQKDALKMYKRYLPTLQLKKQQLQTEIRGIEAKAKARAEERERLLAEFRAWIAVFGEEDAVRTDSGEWLLAVREIRTTSGNIAGVEIPVYAGADFELADYDLYL